MQGVMKDSTLDRYVINEIQAHYRELTKQQFKTLKGQALKGDYRGALKGLRKILKKG